MKKLIILSLLLNILNIFQVTAQKSVGDKLIDGQKLKRNQSMTSPSGNTVLTLTSSGNLELKKDGQLMWESKTTDGNFLYIENDGKVILTDESGSKHLWETNSNEGTTLHIKDNGNLVTFKNDDPHMVSWSLMNMKRQYLQNGMVFDQPVDPQRVK